MTQLEKLIADCLTHENIPTATKKPTVQYVAFVLATISDISLQGARNRIYNYLTCSKRFKIVPNPAGFSPILVEREANG